MLFLFLLLFVTWKYVECDCSILRKTENKIQAMFGFSFPSKSIKELLHRTFGFVANKLKYKKTIAITLLTIISVWTVIVLTRMALANSRRLPFVHWGPREIDISCHYSNEEDSLQTTDENFRPPPKSIFFHETSCRKNLDPRQACAVESAARVHKEWQINVIFAAALDNETLNSGRLAALKKFTNVKFLRVHIEEYAKGTALESIVANSGLGSTYWPVSQTSDVLRFLSLYKYGGVYLDLDVIVSRPFDTLAKNWAAKEGADLIGSAAVAFSSDKMGKHMAETAINDMAEHFRGDLWTRNGPDVLTRILRTRCETNLTARMSAKTCKGFEVYDPSFFFPIHWIYTRAYFDPGKLSALTNYAYGYHMWNRLTEQYPIQEGSPYSRLAMKLCPTIFDMHKKEFGGPKKQ